MTVRILYMVSDHSQIGSSTLICVMANTSNRNEIIFIYYNSTVQMKITLFSPLESETGLCFCLEVEDEEGRVDGSDVDLMVTTFCFAS